MLNLNLGNIFSDFLYLGPFQRPSVHTYTHMYMVYCTSTNHNVLLMYGPLVSLSNLTITAHECYTFYFVSCFMTCSTPFSLLVGIFLDECGINFHLRTPTQVTKQQGSFSGTIE